MIQEPLKKKKPTTTTTKQALFWNNFRCTEPFCFYVRRLGQGLLKLPHMAVPLLVPSLCREAPGSAAAPLCPDHPSASPTVRSQECVSSMMETPASLGGHPLHHGWSQENGLGPRLSSWVPVHADELHRVLTGFSLPSLSPTSPSSLISPSVYPVDYTLQHGNEDKSFAQFNQFYSCAKFKSL